MGKLFKILLLLAPIVAFTALSTSTVKAQTSYDTTDSYDYYYDDTYDYDTSGYDYYYDYSYGSSDLAEASVAAGLFSMLFGGVMLVVSIVVGLGSYVYFALTLMIIAKKLNHETPWFAWIPVLNMILLFQLGNQNPLLLLLFLIPGLGALIVGILSIIAIMNICEKRGYDKALGLLSLIPVANFVLLGILAWGKKEPKTA